ncbi:hypothetical protein [Myxacorys almedinensis]|uniref:hypothetical protein n=1 Tax=Myxacorys almedinensis TaxID=2651157 RepID=UPI001EE3AD26|nr:hypothetical protein [Myxacorys almedinensis]
MTIPLLIIVIGLVAWSLHLMQAAIAQRQFSLMLAGTLVASAAAALVGVYFLMGNYMGYLTRISHDVAYNQAAYESVVRYVQEQEIEEARAYLSDSSTQSMPLVRKLDRSVR